MSREPRRPPRSPRVELDSLRHRRHGSRLGEAELLARVDHVTIGDRSVIDDDSGEVVRSGVGACRHRVWLDLPKHVVVRQVTARTLRWAVGRDESWKRQP